jgi:predicted PurR-regulated permease PerM
LLSHLNTWTQPLLTKWGLNLQVDVAQIRQTLYQVLSNHDTDLLRALLDSLRMGGSSFLAILGHGVLMPIVAFYLLLDYPRLVSRLFALVPRRWTDVTHAFVNDVNGVLGHYLRGQLLVMLVLIVFYVTALAALGLDLAFPIGFFTGFFVFVPYLGFGFGLVMGLLAAALEFQSAVGILAVLGVFVAGQVIEGFWLTPKLLGERIGLSPIAVIFALMAFAQLLGFVGVLIALPASAVLVVAVRRLRGAYQASAFYLKQKEDAQ